MEKIEIQKQQVIGWAVVIRKDGDVSYKCLEPIVLSVDGVGECCIDEKNDRVEGDIAGILPAASETYRVTLSFTVSIVWNGSASFTGA